jgi:uncharacterized protein (DUF1330 family)
MMMVLSLFQDFKYLLLMIKNKNHNNLVKDYDKQKSEHLDRLATKMLKNDEKAQKLKGKKINTNFLKLF